ncbi:TadE family protein [Aeoliella sp. SH292]|uniref:TadE family protein n=1 Tax=Aeoliella sp. SH292 TaxID=3454464 RepID=UPI003F977BE1
MFKSTNRRKQHTTRRGTATVELAVCLPMLALLVFGSIQACNLIYLKHALTSAAYEGTLELSRPDATTDSVTERVNQVLAMHNIKQSAVTITPGGKGMNQLEQGTPVSVRVSANVTPNVALSRWFPMPSTLAHTAVGPK